MENTYYTLGLLGVLTILMWLPYVVARLMSWGLFDLLKGYKGGFPATAPEVPLWAVRAQRAHLNMVETLPAFIAVFMAVVALKGADAEAMASLGLYVSLFLYARVAHYVIYILGLPFLRTPAYIVSWVLILLMAGLFL